MSDKNLRTFNVLAGAVGVGVGFRLQNIVSNFNVATIVPNQKLITEIVKKGMKRCAR